jgi:hypothetical protein
MVCGNFILSEIANRVSFFAYLNLRNLLYLILRGRVKNYAQIGLQVSGSNEVSQQ